MRYFLIYNAAMESDSNYSNSFIVDRYKKGLQSTLGNLLNRVTRSKKWNVREAIEQMHEQGLGARPVKTLEELELASLIKDQQQHLEALAGSVAKDFEAGSPKAALHQIMEFATEVSALASWNEESH